MNKEIKNIINFVDLTMSRNESDITCWTYRKLACMNMKANTESYEIDEYKMAVFRCSVIFNRMDSLWLNRKEGWVKCHRKCKQAHKLT